MTISMIATLVIYSWAKTGRAHTQRVVAIEQQRAQLALFHPPLEHQPSSLVPQAPAADLPPDPIWFQLDREVQRLSQQRNLDQAALQDKLDSLQRCAEQYQRGLNLAAAIQAQLAQPELAEHERTVLSQRHATALAELRASFDQALDQRLAALRDALAALEDLRSTLQRTMLTAVAEPLLANLNDLANAEASIATEATTLQQQLHALAQAATDQAGLKRWQTRLEEAQCKVVQLKARQLTQAARQLEDEVAKLEPPLTLDLQPMRDSIKTAEQSESDLTKASQALLVAAEYLREQHDALLLKLVRGLHYPPLWNEKQSNEKQSNEKQWQTAVQAAAPPDLAALALAVEHTSPSQVRTQLLAEVRTNYSRVLLAAVDQWRNQYLEHTFKSIMLGADHAIDLQQRITQIDFHPEIAANAPRRLQAGLHELRQARFEALELALHQLVTTKRKNLKEPAVQAALAKVYLRQAEAQQAMLGAQATPIVTGVSALGQADPALGAAEEAMQELLNTIAAAAKEADPDDIRAGAAMQSTPDDIRGGAPGERTSISLPTAVPAWLITSTSQFMELKLIPQQRPDESRDAFVRRLRKRSTQLDWLALIVGIGFSVLIGLGIIWVPNPTFGATSDWLLALLWGTTAQAALATVTDNPTA